MFELTLVLNNNSNTPLYEQIYQYIKEEIKNGKIGCKSKLPSTRSLAEHLQVSRSTVDMAYTQLISEGYIESVPCKGYFVCEISMLYDIKKENKIKKYKQSKNEKEKYIDFSPRGIDEEHFPYNIWRKMAKNVFNTDSNAVLSGDRMGEYKLREAICNYLFEARNVHCSPQQILVGAGNEYLLMMLCNLLGAGVKNIVMETPTYNQAYEVFRINGKKIDFVEVDRDGINIEQVRRANAEIVYVMPSHNYPLGTVMSIGKRLELIKWANESEERYIIEDDYDSEFRYHGKTIPALKGINNGDNIIYIGTFSKSIAPSLRISYMILPEKLMAKYNEEYYFCSQTVSRISQEMVTEFIEGGYFERHLNKMRAVYRNKHDMIVGRLKEKKLKILGENAGVHILIETCNGMSEKDMIESAKEHGVKVYGLSEFYICDEYKKSEGIIIGFANLSEKEITKGLDILEEVWKL